MARAALRCVFAALVAVLMAQAAAPSTRVVTTIEIVWTAGIEQQAPQKLVSVRTNHAVRRESSSYVSQTRLAPDLNDLFQRPPPSASPFA
ncbi:MAG TPA: hypothetical protein VG345_08690 [Bryobacteraceae bacterium]|nr:hypothetical protein [Bryobacteraceae bacterium]